MLSGKVPFPGNSELEIIGNVIKGDFHFNHEPFSRHSTQAKEFLQCMIKKDVNLRFTAEQAFNHPWIQDQSTASVESIDQQTIESMESTVREVQLRKAVLSYFCQTVTPDNLIFLKECFQRRDPEATGKMSHEEFKLGLQEANMPMLGREFALIVKELDSQESGQI